RAEAAAELAHQLHLVVPALHVALGEHAAAGVTRQRAAELDAPVLHERARLAFAAEAEALQREEQVHAEAVVGGVDVDLVRPHAGHAVQLGGDGAAGGIVEVLQAWAGLGRVDVQLGPDAAGDP